MIEINGEEYTYEKFREDMIRMFDSFRKKSSKHFGECNCEGCECNKCPLDGEEAFGEDICMNSRNNAFKIVERVHRWAKDHPKPKEKVL